MEWNRNIDEAPKSYCEDASYVTASGKKVKRTRVVCKLVWLAVDGAIGKPKVTKSHWIPDEKRWNMCTKNCKPDAWMPYYIPEHPDKGEHGRN